MTDEAMRNPGPLQFGRPPEGGAPRDRPAAFAVVVRDGKVATAFITRPEGAYTDLPGGALEGDETDAEACVREVGEETGLMVRPLRLLGRASQHLRTVEGEYVNNRCALFEAQVTGENAALKIEDDHALQWLDPYEAVRVLRHDAHAWAVLAWMRGG